MTVIHTHYRRSFLAVVLLIVLMPSTYADAPSSVRTTIAALYHKQDLAADRKDAFGALACYDPDVQIFDKNGEQIGYSDQLSAMQTSFKVAKSIHLKTSIVKFSAKGDEAFVETKQTLQTTVVFPGGKKSLRITGITLSRHYWVRGMDGWTIRQARVLGRTFKMGKS